MDEHEVRLECLKIAERHFPGTVENIIEAARKLSDFALRRKSQDEAAS